MVVRLREQVMLQVIISNSVTGASGVGCLENPLPLLGDHVVVVACIHVINSDSIVFNVSLSSYIFFILLLQQAISMTKF